MEQFVKALNKEGKCFEYLCNTFPGISIEKKKIGVLMVQIFHSKDPHFIDLMYDVESVIQNFLANRKASNDRRLLDELIQNYRELSAKISIKMHFLLSHLENFPENCGEVSYEQDKNSIKTSKLWKKDIKDVGLRE